MIPRLVSTGVLCALVALGGAVIAVDPVWDWQATYVYTATGDVETSSLDFSSEYWISCDTPMEEVSNTTSTTQDPTSKETDRVDTANQYVGRERQKLGLILTTVWHCDGSQIPRPTGGPGSGDNNQCNITLVGGCTFHCHTPAVGRYGRMAVHISIGVLANIKATCPDGLGGLNVAQCGTGVYGGCNGDVTTMNFNDSNGSCQLTSGIAVSTTYCSWAQVG